MKYRTVDGDVLDAICVKHYGAGKFDIGAVFAANPGLAALGPVLPSGVEINLPAMSSPAVERPTRIWDQ